jgi:hypothetical protein
MKTKKEKKPIINYEIKIFNSKDEELKHAKESGNDL